MSIVWLLIYPVPSADFSPLFQNTMHLVSDLKLWHCDDINVPNVIVLGWISSISSNRITDQGCYLKCDSVPIILLGTAPNNVKIIVSIDQEIPLQTSNVSLNGHQSPWFKGYCYNPWPVPLCIPEQWDELSEWRDYCAPPNASLSHMRI